MKSTMMIERVARTNKIRNVYRMLTENPEGRDHLGDHR